MDPYKKARIKEELGFLKDAVIFIGVIILPGIGLGALAVLYPSVGGPIGLAAAVGLIAWGVIEQRRGERERRARNLRIKQEIEEALPDWKVIIR